MTTFTLDSITRGIAKRPLKVFLYGCNGIGKTHVSGCFPDPIFMDLEDGMDGQAYPRQRITSWQEAMDFIAFLKDVDHPFKTLVIDSLDRLEKLATPIACTQAGIGNLNEGYGKGVVALVGLFEGLRQDLDDLLQTKDMNVIFIAHEKTHRVQKPGEITHDLTVPSLHDKIWPLFVDWCNVVGHAYFLLKTDTVKDLGFNRKQIIAKADTSTFESGPRLLRVDPSDGVAVCKNRFGFKTLYQDDRINTYAIPFSAKAILSQVDAFYTSHNTTK